MMDAHTWTGASDATAQELVEGVAATLELPRGPVDAAMVAQWRDGLAARGWRPDDGDSVDTPAAHRRHRLRHEASGCWADVMVLPADPADPRYVTVEEVADDEQARYTFSTIRLYGPEGSEILADANLADARPGGTVTWLVSGPAPTSEDPSPADVPRTATANPFRRRFRLPGTSLPMPIVVAVLALAGLVLLAGAGLFWRRSDRGVAAGTAAMPAGARNR